jgi:hypothetical protein
MTLADYYLADRRVVLVPIEHLSPAGMSAECGALLRERADWSAERVRLFDRSFALYWSRGAALAARTRTWMPPRIRHVAVVSDPVAVHPYAQLLNTSAWTMYAGDFDPEASDPELAAYLLAHGDRMAIAGEVTLAALHNAAWWLERTDDECTAFAAAARRSTRPDGDGVRAVAEALPWLRRLKHETVAPPLVMSPHRAIPGTGLLVPRALEHEPRALVDAWNAAARRAVDAYATRGRSSPAGEIDTVATWLATDAPPLLVTAEGGRIVWDPEHRERLGTLRTMLKRGDAAAIAAVGGDLRVVARHTLAFRAALADPTALAKPAPETEQSGYCYLHRDRALIAYNLEEPGMERLRGPALPYATFMLGARAVHEWAHLAVDAGWVPRVASDAEFAARRTRLADLLTAVMASMPPSVRTITARDLADIGAGGSPADGLVGLFLARLSDWQSNLLARRFVDDAEMETYVRHNIRTLRPSYPPTALFRMLVRYLFEYQYLSLSTVPDAATFLMRSTWFDADFIASGVLDAQRFVELADAGAALCASYAVDESRFGFSARR